MALDSVQKRFSVRGVGRPYMRGAWPGAKDAAWRASVGLTYSGVTAAVPAATATLTGTLTTATEQNVASGGRTSLLTLTNDTWVAAGATFDAQRQAIIDGVTSAGSETLGWNNEVRDKEVVGSVVRTSDTVVTITWTAAAAYDITANEAITHTVPAAALVTSSIAVVAEPTATITFIPDVLPGAGGGAKKRRTDRRHYPRRVMVDGRVYWVGSAQEERQLLHMLLEQAHAEQQRAEDDLAQARAKQADAAEPAPFKRRARIIRRLETRVEKAEDQVERWYKYLRALDEEIVTLLVLH